MLDIGCGKLIIEGKVKVGIVFFARGLRLIVAIYAQIKQGQDISHLDKDGITFKDGSKLSADVIVLAYDLTGNFSSILLTHVLVQEMNPS